MGASLVSCDASESELVQRGLSVGQKEVEGKWKARKRNNIVGSKKIKANTLKVPCGEELKGNDLTF